MRRRSYRKEWGLLILSVLIAVTSFIGDYFSNSFNWFARSGAIIVLLAVAVEYRIAAHIYDDFQRAQYIQSQVKLPVPTKAKPTRQRKKVSIFAHVLVVLGTVIWGYGDLVWG